MTIDPTPAARAALPWVCVSAVLICGALTGAALTYRRWRT